MAQSGTCGSCYYFSKGGAIIKDGTCEILKNALGNQKGVNRSDSCQYYTPGTAGTTGFKKGSSCFLTSACVKYFGLPDDCEQLTKLRWYRDEYLKKTESGKTIVNEYYFIAPKIVEKIEEKENKNEYYKYIYDCIEKCIKFIDQKNYEQTLYCYKEMVLKLQNDLL